MNIREAMAIDLLPALYLGEEYIEEAGAYVALEYSKELAAERMLFSVGHPDALFLIAYDSGQPVGIFWGVCDTLVPWSASLIAMDVIAYVRPSYRGHMLGKRFVRMFEDWAASKGASEVRLSVASGIAEERTGALYNTLGYQHLGSQYRRTLNVTNT